jgi:hypothetical protein
MTKLAIAAVSFFLLAAISIGHYATSGERIAREWNAAQTARACEDEAHKIHVICESDGGAHTDGAAYQRRPPTIPAGYRAVFYTTGCITCAVGWVLKKGEQCRDGEWNCMN